MRGYIHIERTLLTVYVHIGAIHQVERHHPIVGSTTDPTITCPVGSPIPLAGVCGVDGCRRIPLLRVDIVLASNIVETVPRHTRSVEPFRTTELKTCTVGIEVENPLLRMSHTTGQHSPCRIRDQIRIHCINMKRSAIAKYDATTGLNTHANIIITIKGHTYLIDVVGTGS